jgi:hypothetical protein
MPKRIFAAAAMALLIAPMAAQAIEPSQVRVYAAFAKFEANISELTLAATAHAILDDSFDEARAEKREEFEEDIEQVAAYIAMLRGEALTDAQAAALDQFETTWSALVAAGEAMIAGDAASPADVAALFEKAEAADEAIDDALDDKLDEMGVDLPNAD